MKLYTLNRRIHYWITAFVAIPVLIVVTSGLLLQLKKHASWIQPAEQRGAGTSPVLDLEAILATVREVPEVGESAVEGWDDIARLDVRPGRGVAKVVLHSGWEVQVDLGTGQILQTAYRRSDLIESIHDGSFFAGDLTKLGLFLPAGIALLLLWISGMWMFWVPFVARRKRTVGSGSRRSPSKHRGEIRVENEGGRTASGSIRRKATA